MATEYKLSYTGAQINAKLSKIDNLAEKNEIPTRTSELINDSEYITSLDIPVQSVNGKTGAIRLVASDVGARPSTWMPSVSDIGALPDSTVIPTKLSQLDNDNGYITEENLNNAFKDIDFSASLLVTVDISTMIADYSKTEIINAARSGKMVYADVMNQLFVLKNIANASFTEVSYLAGSKVDLTSFYIDDDKKVHLNVTDTYNLLPNNSSSDYGKYPTPSANGIVWETLPDLTVDTTLSVEGQAADAKAVGNALAEKQPKGNYLTAVPSEYVTETELNNKGYLTSYTETDPTVPAWAKASTKPSYTAGEVGADASGTASSLVSAHNTAVDAHTDIRNEIGRLSSKIGNFNVDITKLPADGSASSDFNADNMTVQDVYDYLDALIARYPNYIKKETMGKDASNTYDWNRYILYDGFYHAWQKQNYPKMYAWVNGSTIIYSVSVSPRVGDTMYSTTYIGTTYNTVTAVDNENQARTVNGLVFTRDSSKDVEPTVVYCVSSARPGYGYAPDSVSAELIDVNKTKVTSIASVSDGIVVGKDGVTYERKPMLDRDINITEEPSLIVIGANEHGNPEDPREPAIVCSRIMNLMCNPNNDSMIKFLQKNKVVFMPIMNPYSFTEGNAGYYNVNGVNINRNYDVPGWVNQDTTSGGPKGNYGGSEIETQYIMNTYYGADVAVSVHAYNYNNSATDNEITVQAMGVNQDLFNRVASIMYNRYQLVLNLSEDAAPDSYSKSASYINHIGAKGGIIEMNAREGATNNENTSIHSGWILHADYVFLMECLKMWSIDAEILTTQSGTTLPNGDEVSW